MSEIIGITMTSGLMPCDISVHKKEFGIRLSTKKIDT